MQLVHKCIDATERGGPFTLIGRLLCMRARAVLDTAEVRTYLIGPPHTTQATVFVSLVCSGRHAESASHVNMHGVSAGEQEKGRQEGAAWPEARGTDP